MEEKPTHSSVTSELCNCGYLQRSANNENSPIVFDERAHEYQFRYRDHEGRPFGMLIIYHCPFCGGAAPKSQRASLFETIPQDEQERLLGLLRPLHSIDAATSALGPPDLDDFTIQHFDESVESPPRTSCLRELRYYGVSQHADVSITQRNDGSIFFHFYGKPIE